MVLIEQVLLKSERKHKMDSFTNGKKKAITFSFDDGVIQDRRLVALMDKYNLKGTFNLNSGMLGKKDIFEYEGKTVDYSRVEESEIRKGRKPILAA